MGYTHLIVNGYNVIHAWPELRACLDTQGEKSAVARHRC